MNRKNVFGFRCATGWLGQPCTQNKCLSYETWVFSRQLANGQNNAAKEDDKKSREKGTKGNSARRYMVEEKGKIDRQR